jgi:predicted nucleotidyltransferase
VNKLISIENIKAEIYPLTKKYDISWIDLFGSYANGNATKKSDVDFLVKFTAPVPSIFAVMGFKEELSRRLKIPVDVVTFPLFRPEKLNIQKTIRIYEK